MKLTWILLIAVLSLAGQPARAATARVAVAADFLPTLKGLAPIFQRQTGQRIAVSAGSTGMLYAQIVNGAPYDVFLAADDAAPRRLRDRGLGVAGTERTYAVGRLVLWGVKVDPRVTLADRLEAGDIRHLALAEPATAPYGAAARRVLVRLGLWMPLQSRMVFGASVGQAFQYAASGGAQLGFVALAQVRHHAGPDAAYIKVPQALYRPLVQDMVLLTRGKSNAAARAFLRFMGGATARSLIAESGYALPPGPATAAQRARAVFDQ